jgi:hypothetical protein
MVLGITIEFKHVETEVSILTLVSIYLRLDISPKVRDYIHRKQHLHCFPVIPEVINTPTNHLDSSETSTGSKASDGRNRLSLSTLSTERAEEARIGTRQRTGVIVLVNLANVTNIAGASSVGGSIRAGKDGTGRSLLDSGLDVLEEVSLGENLGFVAGLEGVAGVVGPVVVDGVEDGVSGDLGGAAGGLGDVVVLHGDHLVIISIDRLEIEGEIWGLTSLEPVKYMDQYWCPSQVADHWLSPLMWLLVIETRLSALVPRTMCCRPMLEVVT